QGRCLLLQELGVAHDMAKGCAKVVGNGIGKRFEVPVARLQVCSAPGELAIEFANLLLPLLALLDFDPKVVAGAPKVILDAAARAHEPGYDDGPGREQEKIGQILARNFEGVEGRGEEVAEAGGGGQEGRGG